ncbi:MAG: pirin family protein [Gammaproteobacteria bacterium]|nr:pirin family protein [Gammaproteobacteria bacterium]
MNAVVEERRRLRGVQRMLRGQPAMDGAGVRLTRVIGTPELDHLDPFLLFDVFESDNPDDYIAGFPPHPHRGFETVTYMLAGHLEHRDSVGNQGVIETGGVQWMTAGRGIIHSEMPKQADGLLRGVQIWVNLPAHLKMSEPAYREYDANQIPEDTMGASSSVRVVAGETATGVTGPVSGVVTQPLFWDLVVGAGAEFTESIPDGHTALLFVVEGEMAVRGQDGESRVPERHLAILAQGDTLALRGAAARNRALLLAAAPIGEPVARSGPFVMNTRAEVIQAFNDYQSGRLARPYTLEKE